MRRAALLLAAFATPASAPADAQPRAGTTVLMSENPGERAFQERYGFSDAVIAGDTIYMSGVVVGQNAGETLEAAYERTYRRIAAILARAGAGWDDVVDLTSYHTEITAQLEAMAAVHRRHVNAPFPAWTAIDIDRLVPDGGITEIKIVARRRNAPASPAPAAGN